MESTGPMHLHNCTHMLLQYADLARKFPFRFVGDLVVVVYPSLHINNTSPHLVEFVNCLKFVCVVKCSASFLCRVVFCQVFFPSCFFSHNHNIQHNILLVSCKFHNFQTEISFRNNRVFRTYSLWHSEGRGTHPS